MRAALCLVCLLSVSMPAHAGIDLGIGGYMAGYGVYVDQDSATGHRNFGLRRETRLVFEGETTLDNGLKVGGYNEIFVDRGDPQRVDKSFLYLEGGWGRLNLGESEGAPELMQVEAPSADKYVDGIDPKINGVDLGAMGGSAATPGTLRYDQQPTGKAAKIVYFTPVIAGFQAAASIAPGVDDADLLSNAPMTTDDDIGDFDTAIEGAVHYETKALGFDWTAGAGISHVSLEATDPVATNAGSDERLAWNAAINMGWDAWTIGAAYVRDNNGIKQDGDSRIAVIGANYEVGAVTYGVSYLNRMDETAFAGVADTETSRLSGGAVYNYAPGLSLRGSVGYIETDRANTGGNGVQAALGTVINF